VCGKTATAQVKESGIPYFGGPPAEWSLHCGACKTPLMTTVFEALRNPLLRDLNEKNRKQYENNEERLRANNLIAGGAWKHGRHLARLKRQFPELMHVAAEPTA
jgi:hypothetical protein